MGELVNPDSIISDSSYSIPQETRSILKNGLLNHPAHQDLPPECQDLLSYIEYTGLAKPKIPINWRLAESVSSLKGLEGILLNLLLVRKYGIQPQKITINTDHAQLFFMSSLLVEIQPNPHNPVQPTPIRDLTEKYAKYFPNGDLHQMASSQYRRATTNIYKARDGRFFHLHGSLNPDLSLKAIEFPWDRPEIKTAEDAWPVFAARIAEKDASEWDHILGETHRQAATICWSPEEFASSAQGQAIKDVGLYKVHYRPNENQKPGWWPDVPSTSPSRPLAGLKIVDLTRVIAGPAIGRSLAEMGASVMRVTAPHLADFSGLHPDLNWGKWNCSLDLRKDDDRAKLRELVLEADVVINGYRPMVLDKYGFGNEDVFKLCKDRERGIIYVRENCFGWAGPLAHRSGWQPISDANSGISMGYGRAMGNDEPATPVFPNSDYCTGIAGSCAVLQALIQKSTQGGSYLIDTALNYYNQWLAQVVGEYPKDIWEEVWSRSGRQVFRHYHSMNYTIPRYIEIMKKNEVFNLDHFETRSSEALGGLLSRVPKPVLQFPSGVVKLGYHIGTRGNGVDEARWPEDLTCEVVT
ncbi:alpha-methylacyl-CoA racemase [Xylogone sp. PMI_703]|nr:alpha-methylacyl-CoA racemase [Xylogone sp. PMI_703]